MPDCEECCLGFLPVGCILGLGPFVMMIVVLTIRDRVAWNDYIDNSKLLCNDFGFVPKPYYLELVKVITTQIILQLVAKSYKTDDTKPNKLEVIYFIFQVVVCWGSTISIFSSFPLSNEYPTDDGWYDYNMVVYMFSSSTACITGTQFLVNAFMIIWEQGALGEKLMNRLKGDDELAAAASDPASGIDLGVKDDNNAQDEPEDGMGSASGIDLSVKDNNNAQDEPEDAYDGPLVSLIVTLDPVSRNPNQTQKQLKAEIDKLADENYLQTQLQECLTGSPEALPFALTVKPGSLQIAQNEGCCCDCYYHVKRYMKKEVECLPELYCVYIFTGIFILLPILPALLTHYGPMLWAYIWLFLPAVVVLVGIMSFVNKMAEDKFLEDIPDIIEVPATLFIRCLLIFMALFAFQAPLEIGCFLYGYSLNSMPVDGGEYLGAISHWWNTRDTEEYFDCVADSALSGIGEVFDVLSWF